jgi:adenylate kinase family enzyme
MKILIYLFTIVFIASSCSQIKNNQKKSQLDERIENSKYSTEYRLIKEIIEDTDVLIDKDNVNGCIDENIYDYSCRGCIDIVDCYFNIYDLIIIKEYSEKYYHNGLRKYFEFLVIHTKMPGADY